MVNQSISILLQVIAIVGIISAVVYGILLFYRDYREKRIKELETFHNSFDSLVEKLTSDNIAAQLSSAILLRRYFKKSQEDEEQDIIDSRIAKWITSKQRKYLRPIDLKYKKDLKIETVGVISSLLRILPTGVFQKTLADGLGYASDLSKCDLQKTNMQDV
jgi:type II secretory pathway pseudopilin PulG